MSKIQWTDKTWNPVAGCKMVSAGCANCYAQSNAARLVRIGRGSKASTKLRAMADLYADVVTDKGRWNGQFVQIPERLEQPLRWKQPRTIFVCSMSDLFGEGVSFGFIAAVWAVMAATPRHRYQVLTKRPERAREFFEWLDDNHIYWWGALESYAQRYGVSVRPSPAPEATPEQSSFDVAGIEEPVWSIEELVRPIPNIMLGVSAENQETWDERTVELQECPAARYFVSVEPMLSPIRASAQMLADIDQVIIGCESKGAHLGRPTRLEWVQGLAKDVLAAQQYVDCLEHQCGQFTGPALFIKQLDVCRDCAGLGSNCDDCIKEHGPRKFTPQECEGGCTCGRSGQSGKLRKATLDPRKPPLQLYLPGHGTHQWMQRPEGW